MFGDAAAPKKVCRGATAWGVRRRHPGGKARDAAVASAGGHGGRFGEADLDRADAGQGLRGLLGHRAGIDTLPGTFDTRGEGCLRDGRIINMISEVE